MPISKEEHDQKKASTDRRNRWQKYKHKGFPVTSTYPESDEPRKSVDAVGHGYIMQGRRLNQPLLLHHFTNVRDKKDLINEDGTRSTIRSAIMGADGKEWLYPTVWDGKILDDKEAFHRSMKEGVAMPFKSVDEAQAYDDAVHKDIEHFGHDLEPDLAGSLIEKLVTVSYPKKGAEAP